jgi:hypothetical protein
MDMQLIMNDPSKANKFNLGNIARYEKVKIIDFEL